MEGTVETNQIVVAIVVIGLVIIVFGLDWADRRRHDQMMDRNQKTMDLLRDFITNPEISRIATGVSEDTPVGLTFIAPEPDPHIWVPYFESHEVILSGADWPSYRVQKWERNEIGETRYVDTIMLEPPDKPAPQVKARSISADAEPNDRA